MPLGRQKKPFSHPDWLFEIKFDGFSALAYSFNDSCKLVSWRGNTYKSRILDDVSARIPANLKAKNAVLDGELCCLGQNGRSIFKALMGRKEHVYFYVCDLFWLNGKDYRGKPLIERKAKLRWLIPQQLAPLLYLDHVEENGIDLFEQACRHDMEGIVAKRKDGIYTADAKRSVVQDQESSL